MRQTKYLLVLLLPLLSYSCSRDSVVHEDLIIDGNVAPPIDGVAEITLNNYINNLYIDLYGRAATEDEISDHVTYLKENNYAESARKVIVEELLNNWDYYKNFNLLTSQKLLVNLDSFSLKSQIDYWVYIIDLLNATGMETEAYYYTYENNRLLLLSTAHVDLYNGVIGIKEYYRRYIDNYFYDQVNMGSENFVVSCFTNLLHRYPTDDEKLQGVNMCDGGSGHLFLQDGSSKGDFIEIFVNSLEFYQGQVIEVYQAFLARLPESVEMNEYSLQMQEEDNFNNVKVDILISEEYAGF